MVIVLKDDTQKILWYFVQLPIFRVFWVFKLYKFTFIGYLKHDNLAIIGQKWELKSFEKLNYKKRKQIKIDVILHTLVYKDIKINSALGLKKYQLYI